MCFAGRKRKYWCHITELWRRKWFKFLQLLQETNERKSFHSFTWIGSARNCADTLLTVLWKSCPPVKQFLIRLINYKNFTKADYQLQKKVINALKCDLRNDAQRAVFNHSTRYIKSLGKGDLMTLLRFITAGDLAPDAIVVNFEEQVFRAPSVRTCGNILNLSASYSCYNELAEEFTNVLRNKESLTFYFAWNRLCRTWDIWSILAKVFLFCFLGYSHYFMGFLIRLFCLSFLLLYILL